MALAAPVDRTFEDQTAAVGANATVPSGVVAVGTAQVANGQGGGKAIAFRGASGSQLYWQDLFPSQTSDYLQFSGEFMIEALPSSNGDLLGLVTGTGTTQSCSFTLLTTGATLFRDGGGSSTVTGWTNVTLAINTWYRIQIATIRSTSGSSPFDGQIKARLTRISDGVVLAQGAGTACNTSTNLARGSAYGRRTAAGTFPQVWDNVRTSDQAYDFLEEPIPASSGTETWVSTPFSCGYIGDSTTDRSGTGTGQNGNVETRLVATGKFQASEVRVNGLTGRPIELTTVTPNGLQVVDNWRTEGYDPGVFVVALGENGASSSVAQQQTWITDMLNKIAEGPRSRYVVYWIGVSRRDSADTASANFWTALSGVTPPSKISWNPINYNALLHNGRDETGFWQSTNATEPHMTSTGYTTRDSIINSQIQRPADQVSLSGVGTLSVVGKAVGIAKPILNYQLGISIPAYSGVGGGILFAGTTEMNNQIDAVAAAGIGWLRTDMIIQQADPNATGTYDWTAWDATFTYARSKGIKILGILGSTITPTTAAERTKWSNFAVAVANRYSVGSAYQVDALEVGNEMNLERFWPSPTVTGYGELLKAVYQAVKAVRPAMTVITCGSGGAGGSANDIRTDNWYLGLFSNSYIQYTDALTLHSYSDFTGTPGTNEEQYVAPLRSYADSNGASSKPLWSTETGAPTTDGSVASQNLQDRILQNSWNYWKDNAGATRGPLFYYTLSDFAAVGSSSSENYYGLRKYDKTTKPSYQAVTNIGTSSTQLGISGRGTLSTASSSSSSQSASLSGTGTLATSSTASASSSSSLSGTGTLSTTSTPKSSTTAALTGTGTLSSSNTPRVAVSAALSGTGTLSVGTTTPVVVQTAALTGTGTFSTSTTNNRSDTAALSGTGTLSSSNRASAAGSAALGGTGTLSASGTPLGATSAALTGTGTLSAVGTVNPSSTVALGGTGTLAASSNSFTSSAATLGGTGTLSASPSGVKAFGTLAVGGTGTLAVLGNPLLRGTAALTGTGVLSAAGTPSFVGPLAIFGQGDLSATGGVRYSSTSALLGTGALSATGVGTLAQPLFDIFIQGVWLKGRTLGVGMNGGLAPVQAV